MAKLPSQIIKTAADETVRSQWMNHVWAEKTVFLYLSTFLTEIIFLIAPKKDWWQNVFSLFTFKLCLWFLKRLFSLHRMTKLSFLIRISFDIHIKKNINDKNTAWRFDDWCYHCRMWRNEQDCHFISHEMWWVPYLWNTLNQKEKTEARYPK